MQDLLIQRETLVDIADSIRLSLEPTTEVLFIPQFIIDHERLNSSEIVVNYTITINGENYYPGDYLGFYDYAEHPLTGKIVPRIWEISADEDIRQEEYDECFWYNGRVNFKGQIYDSWRNVSDMYSLEGPVTQTIYTNVITYTTGQELPLSQYSKYIKGMAQQITVDPILTLQAGLTPFLVTQNTKQFVGYSHSDNDAFKQNIAIQSRKNPTAPYYDVYIQNSSNCYAHVLLRVKEGALVWYEYFCAPPKQNISGEVYISNQGSLNISIQAVNFNLNPDSSSVFLS